ncbi:DUF922 domain-containing protein [Gilvimarinus sp. 1_MG-2023]|uniref:DUF922 domain-containing protein n=1 Tax=Gilvimarinus sp. 1_MG-2023 TaxID=3062638 RepID=UPI0026E3AE42|nr:DUF922 domain-containing protein [Gilvimarinus sp. 1_MG-2023]MDO6746607.1 DUF922 domain-containing protein [Gilvimarinus sp. 1_MG-2023]
MSIFCSAKKTCAPHLLMMLTVGFSCLAQALDFSVEREDNVEESIDYIYYEIEDPALTGQSLKQSLDAATPVVKAGVKRHGENRWLIRWQSTTQQQESSCKVTDVSVTLNATVLLPELSASEPEIQSTFNDYVAALQEYLLLHYVVALQAANKIELAILNLPPASDCKVLEQQADEKARAIVKEHREKGQSLDAMTDYGVKQGVVLEGTN